jgi:hypothetical protein
MSPRACALGLVVVLVLGAAGCGKGKKDGASCDDVGARFLALAHQQLDSAAKAGDVDAELKTRVESHVPAMRDAMVRACKEDGWAKETRDCFANAAGDTEMTGCYQSMPAEQRALLEKASSPPTR